MNLKIQFVDSIFGDETTYAGDESFRKDLPPGSAKWAVYSGAISTLLFTCPCGCGAVCHVAVRPCMPNGWDWNGSMELPTLQPSILRTTGCRWHGYLTDGFWTS